MEQRDKKIKYIYIIAIILLIIIILYLLILDFGKIKNHNSLMPTGNIDIFDITCNCKGDECTNNSASVFDEDTNNHLIDIDKNKFNENIIVADNYSIWGEEKLRIFSNPAYEYTSKIAPGSSNSYTFVVRNNNNFDIVVDFNIIEENDYDINMGYKLRSKGIYLVGDPDTYRSISDLQLKNITIKAKESISYILDWKWIDSADDTEIGFNLDANYKLTINIGANQK